MNAVSTTAGGGRRRFLMALGALTTLAVAGRAAASELLSFDALYAANGVLGLKFSEKTLAQKGKSVRLRGYMAPPLKPESNFFVLTREPVAICPFCSSDAEWPVDIVVVYTARTAIPGNLSERIEAEGTLEVGSSIDATTGFVSQLRLRDAAIRKIN